MHEPIIIPLWRYLDEAPPPLRIVPGALDEQCPACDSKDIVKVKGCLRCLKCGFKQDCNGF